MWKNTFFLELKLYACAWARSAKLPKNEVSEVLKLTYPPFGADFPEKKGGVG